MDQISIQYGIASDIGLKRKNNEDCWLINNGQSVLAKNNHRLFIVADGMGGGPAGEIASFLAVQEVQKQYFASIAHWNASAAINSAVLAAHHRIRTEVIKQPQYAGMGTTLTALVLHNHSACVAHVGDSRAYLMRNKQIIQLTHDQNLTADMVRSGQIRPESARNHPRRNILTQSVGGRNLQPEVEIISREVRNEDKFLLCSDGLHNLLTDEEIMETILLHADLQSSAEDLIQQANARGGSDNITALIIELNRDANLLA